MIVNYIKDTSIINNKYEWYDVVDNEILVNNRYNLFSFCF